MAKPDDIPQDVWDAAQVAAKEATRDAMRDPLMPYFVTAAPHFARAVMAERKRIETLLSDPVAVRLNWMRGGIDASAITAEERERCAAEAEARFTEDTVKKNKQGLPYPSGNVAIWAARQIAAAIRQGEK